MLFLYALKTHTVKVQQSEITLLYINTCIVSSYTTERATIPTIRTFSKLLYYHTNHVNKEIQEFNTDRKMYGATIGQLTFSLLHINNVHTEKKKLGILAHCQH